MANLPPTGNHADVLKTIFINVYRVAATISLFTNAGGMQNWNLRAHMASVLKEENYYCSIDISARICSLSR